MFFLLAQITDERNATSIKEPDKGKPSEYERFCNTVYLNCKTLFITIRRIDIIARNNIITLLVSCFVSMVFLIESGNIIIGNRIKTNIAITIIIAFILSFLYSGIIILRSPCHKEEESLD